LIPTISHHGTIVEVDTSIKLGDYEIILFRCKSEAPQITLRVWGTPKEKESGYFRIDNNKKFIDLFGALQDLCDEHGEWWEPQGE
jgi:hypothetical protein